MRLTQHGSFDELLEKLVRQQLLVEFAEDSTDSFDFARCQRPDGSHYPIADGLQCRKGTKAADAPTPKIIGRKKNARPTDTAARMAAAYDKIKNKRQEGPTAAIKKVDKKFEPKAAKSKDKTASPKIRKVELDITENNRKRAAAARLIEKLPDGVKVSIDGEKYATLGGMLKQGYESQEASGLLRYADKVSIDLPVKFKSKAISKEPDKEKTPKSEAKKSKPSSKLEQAKPKKEGEANTITPSTKFSVNTPEIKLDPETVEKNITRVEKQAQADIPKIKQEILSAKKRGDENAKLEAEERLGRAEELLRKIKIDREALKSGEFDKPARQFTQAQLDRIDARIKYLIENQIQGPYGRYLSPQYYDLVALRRSANPLLSAKILGEERRIKAKYDKMGEGPEREKLREKWSVLEAKKKLATQSKEDRLKSYISSDGMVKMLRSDADPKQNAAHRGSNLLFAEHGELGNSVMAKSLIKKYGGNRGEVQRGIDAVIDFTQNSYVTIRRGVKEGDPAQIQRADRINRIVEQLPHPAVVKYRGMEVNKNVLDEFVRAADNKLTFSDIAPASWSTSAQIAADYTGKGGASVIFETNNKRGASVENWGQSGEKEILTPGGTNYRYLGYRTEVHEGKPIYVFTVEELDS